MGAPKSVKDWMELARSMGADALGIANDPEAVVTLLRMRLGCQDKTHEDGRPMLAVEAASSEHRGTNGGLDPFRRFMDEFGTPPHCDQRILHRPEDCEYCAHADIMQAERALLGVRNTGVEGDQDGRVHPCPAELARSKESLAHWGGNRPVSADAYAAQALRSSSTDLGYPGEPAEEDLCPYCRCLKPCPCEGG